MGGNHPFAKMFQHQIPELDEVELTVTFFSS